MNKLLPLIVALGAALFPPSESIAADRGNGYDAYKVVRTRNIFDPNRKAVREVPPKNAPAPRSRSSTFTLTGTMVREGRSLAFFSGSRSEFSKVIGVGDSVANYKITAIAPAQVELEHDGKKLTLEIGKPFQIEGSPGEPEPPEEPAAEANATNEPNATDAPPPASPTETPASTDPKAEILRRMMERRAKEMNK